MRVRVPSHTPKLHRLNAVACALAIVLGSSAAATSSASATQPPKSCVDDPTGDGCPHESSGGGSGEGGAGGGGGGSGAVLNTYIYVDTAGLIRYYIRVDGARAVATDASRLERWVQIFDPAGICWLSHDRPGSLACRYH